VRRFVPNVVDGGLPPHQHVGMTANAMNVGAVQLVEGAVRGVKRDDRGRWRLNAAANGEVSFAVHDLGVASRVRIDWLDQWTAPLRWNKSPANPIYGPHRSGAWDNWTNGVSIVPTADGQKYRMYYSGRAGEGIGFAEANVNDPQTWYEHPASPVLKPRADNWEGNLINQPRVVAVTPEHWRMYYTGWGFNGPGTKWALGLAESFDGGTTWTRLGDEPILPRGDKSSPDGAGACVPMVLRVGDRWFMWYTAGQLNPAGHQNIHICLATSRDGVTWEKHANNPVLTDDFTDGAARSVTSRCYVRHDRGVFRMWYSFAKPNYRICYAESLDGIVWERAPISPVLDASVPPAWDDVMVEYPEVQIVDSVFRLWFCGNGFGSVGYAEGLNDLSVEVFARSGDTAVPDAAWSRWQPVRRDESIAARRYIQVRAEMSSAINGASPALNHVSIHPA